MSSVPEALKALQAMERLENRVETFLEQVVFLKKENQILQQQKIALEEKLRQKEADLSLLEARLENVKIAKSIVGSDLENTEVKKTLNALIKELDKCIEGLSIRI